MPTETRFFDDILDGYVPIGVSLRQCLDRNGIDAAFVVITQAPVLHLPGRSPDAPVPLRLGDEVSGLIRRLAVMTTRSHTWGLGEWRWQDGAARGLGTDDRLAEPAFVRGVAGKCDGEAPCLTAAGRDWGLTAPPGFAPIAQGILRLGSLNLDRPAQATRAEDDLPPIARALIDDWTL